MATPPKIVGTQHIILTVSDLERSVRFYTTVLGFKAVRRGVKVVRPGVQSPVVLLSNGVYGLGLNLPWRTLTADESTFDESRVGLDHLAFALGSIEEVRQAVDHLNSHGVPNSGFKEGRHAGAVLVTFRDPDNIQLEYYYLPPEAERAFHKLASSQD